MLPALRANPQGPERAAFEAGNTSQQHTTVLDNGGGWEKWQKRRARPAM